MRLERLFLLGFLAGLLGGAVAGWSAVAWQLARLGWAARPPVAVVDYGAALRPGGQGSEAVAAELAALERQVARLRAAGWLVLRREAVLAAPPELLLRPQAARGREAP